MNQKRLEWVDIAKGIGIILVVLGHCVPYGGTTFNLIFTFHMPLFFILSGYCYVQRGIRTTFDKKLKSLLVPFAKYFLLGLVITLIIPQWRNSYSLKGVIRDIYLASPDGCNNSSIWFLSCLFIVTMMFSIAQSITERMNNRQVVRVSLLILSTLAGYLLSINEGFMKRLPGQRLPFALDTAFVAVLFFAIGYELKNGVLLNRLTTRKSIMWGIGFLIITVLVSCLNGKVNIHALTFKNPILYLLGALTGSGFVICLSKVLENSTEKIKTLFVYYGKNSLIILGTQSVFIRLFILVENNLFGTEYKLYRLPVVDGLICFALVAFAISPFICSLSKKIRKAGKSN